MYIDLSKTEIVKGPGGELVSEEKEEYEKVFLAKVGIHWERWVGSSQRSGVKKEGEGSCQARRAVRSAEVSGCEHRLMACPVRATGHRVLLASTSQLPASPLVLQVPIMLRSTFCSLHDLTDKELTELGECPYDSVSQAQTETEACDPESHLGAV